MKAYGHGSDSPREPHHCCPGHTPWVMPSRYTYRAPHTNRDASRRPWKKRARMNARTEIQAELVELDVERDTEMRTASALAELRRERDMHDLDMWEEYLKSTDWEYWTDYSHDPEMDEQIFDSYYEDLNYLKANGYWPGYYGWPPYDAEIDFSQVSWKQLYLDGLVSCWQYDDYWSMDFWYDFDDFNWVEYTDVIPDAPWLDSGNTDEVTFVGKTPVDEHVDVKHAHSLRRKQKYGSR